MRMVSPNTGADELTLAEEQPQYMPLTVARYSDESGVVYLLSRWRLNDVDRARVTAGEDLYVALMTFGEAPQPLSVQVGADGWQGGAEETTKRIAGDVTRELTSRVVAELEAFANRERLMVAVFAEWATLLGLDPEVSSPNDLDREIRRLVEEARTS